MFACVRRSWAKVADVNALAGLVNTGDCLPTVDLEGLAELAKALDVPITMGEFIFSPYDYAKYIRYGALDEVRFIVDNLGGITGGMKVAHYGSPLFQGPAPHR
jgi:L-alanine-DL-glutamate epimerase-like enolase superfamily enzyme